MLQQKDVSSGKWGFSPPISNYRSWCLIALYSFPQQLLGHGDPKGNGGRAVLSLSDVSGHFGQSNLGWDRLLPCSKGASSAVTSAK